MQQKTVSSLSARMLMCHVGELILKGKNRRYFEDILLAELRAKFDKLGVASIRKYPGRMVVEFHEPHPLKLLNTLASKCIGIANARPVVVCRPDLDEIRAIIPSLVNMAKFNSFAIRCRRIDKRFPYSSQQICVELGNLVAQLSGARVDLDAPEWMLRLEILPKAVYISTSQANGVGGLPVGSSGRVMALLSGGIDSPVAVWRIMRRGCRPYLLHFHSFPYTTTESQEKVVDMARLLATWHAPLSLGMVPFGELQQRIVTATPAPLRIILYRRLMVRIATRLAAQKGADALVTGDSLGQVASQTLSNLATIDEATSLPILRPLIGMDKIEITDEARRIGTYDTSIEPHQDCCSFLEPTQPATRSKASEVERAESALDIVSMVKDGVDGAEWKVIAE